MRALRLGESCAYIASDRRITLYGCEGVTEYSADTVVLRLCDTMVTVRGCGLTLSAFYSAEISVEGRITSLEIERRCK